MQLVKLMGGLGNQMFQYAFAKALGDKNILFYGDYKKHSLRKVELNRFKCKAVYMPRELFKYLKFVFTKFDKIEYMRSGIYVPEYLNRDGNHIYIGFWQTEKYFKQIRPRLLKDFTPRKKLDRENAGIISKMQQINSVSVHIRRTDYVDESHIYGDTNLDYYKRAIEYISSKIENPEFFFFSDDMAYVKEKFAGLKFPHSFIDINSGNNSYKDLILMKNCKHNIIANSTFSWWGAWLNENTEKIVIAPAVWFIQGENDKDIIPDEWIKL